MSSRLQLAVKGKACGFLTSQPEMSLFRAGFRRYTNFASNSEELQLLPRVEFGQKVECILQHSGDLISSIHVVIRLPELNVPEMVGDERYEWIDEVAYHLIESCNLYVGSQLIVSLSSMYIYLNSQINQNNSSYQDYQKLVDKKNKTIYLKLPFWFSKHIGLSLPLLCIKSPVKLVIKFRDLNELYRGPRNLRIQNNKLIVNASLLVNYIYLDEEERQSFIENEHKYLIEQPQYITNINFGEHESVGKIPLTFNNAVFQLMWIVQKNDLMSWKKKIVKEEEYEYEEDGVVISGNNWYDLELEDNEDSFEFAKLVMNGTDRTNNLPASYFRLLQNKEHCSRVPDMNIYTYNFGLQNDQNQPSGAINFNVTSNINLTMEFNSNKHKKNVTVIAKNYNLLKFKKGLVELKY